MIARFAVALPYEVVVPHSATLPPLEFDHGPYHIKVYAPVQGQIDPQLRFFKLASLPTILNVPWSQLCDRIRPVETPGVFDDFTIDGDAAVQANLLQIEFQKESFDRRLEPGHEVEPPVGLVFAVANGFLAHLRALTRAGFVHALDPRSTFWRIDYLDDTGERLSRMPGLARRQQAMPFQHQLCWINEASWEQIRDLAPLATLHLWDELITEARALLVQDVRLAIVVACTALESFSAWCLDQCAEQKGVHPELWHWINHRERHEYEPSTTESFGCLLKVLHGCSLEEDPALWKAYSDLRKARNNFVHEGRPYLVSNKGNEKPVTAAVAAELVNQAEQIIDWVEARLPAELRRARLEGTAAHVQWAGPPEPLFDPETETAPPVPDGP
jgi:hypothetical protein